MEKSENQYKKADEQKSIPYAHKQIILEDISNKVNALKKKLHSHLDLVSVANHYNSKSMIICHHINQSCNITSRKQH